MKKLFAYSNIVRIFAKGEFACGQVTCRKTMFCWRPDVFSPDIRSCRYRLEPESRSFSTFAGRKNKTDIKPYKKCQRLQN